MKNLKRALSLVLSAAMMVGMMVVGTGAAYTDVTAEHNEEAIAVMEAAGIMEGDGKGFNPDNKVTRHEMAVVMANLLDLKVEDFNGAETPFTDVAAWAAPYVAACYADGIMAGTSATTFGGNINVTAAQAALMMMKALGYFQFQPDFGEDWQLATVKQASKIDLFDGMDVGATTELTRNDVAQLALNTLESDIVDYEGSQGTNITLSDGTSILTGYTIKYNPIVERGSDDYTQGPATPDDTYTQLVEELFGNDLKKFGATDDFGRSANEWKFKTEGLGKFAKQPDAVYANKVTKATLYNLVGKDVVEDIESALTADAAAVLTVIVDGQTVATINGSTAAAYMEKNNTGSIGKAGSFNGYTDNACTTEVYIDNDTNAVKVVIINKYLIQATDDYSAKKEQVLTATIGNVPAPVATSELTLKAEDFAITEVAEDDYLVITCAGTGATNKVIKSVEPATVVTGEVSTFTAGKNVTIDGTKYSYAMKVDTTTSHGKNVSYAIGEDAKVVTDGTFVMYVEEATVAADKFVFISAIEDDGKFDDKDFVGKAFFLDGTAKVINIKDKFSDKSLVNETTTPAWYAYTVNSEDVYTLTNITVGSAAENQDSTSVSDASTALIENGKVSINSAIKANAETVFVIVDEDENVTSYTGISAIPTVKTKATSPVALTAFYVISDNAGYAEYVFINAENGVVDGATDKSSDFIYLLKHDATGVDADKNDYYVYKAIVNGEITTVTLNDKFNASQTVMALYNDVKYDEAGYVDSMDQIVDADDDYEVKALGAVNYEGGVLTIGSADYVVASDCEIVLVAADKANGNVMEDTDADYEISTGMSANSLAVTLKGLTLTGSYVAEIDEDTDALVALYVYVSAAV